jgi:cysteine-rich repeat protein
MRARVLVVALLVLSTVLMTGRAKADVYWSSIATACTPSSTAIQDDRYTIAPDSTVALKPAELDPIVLICSVPMRAAGLPPNLLSMTYLDSTGTAATAKVQAQLIRVQRSNGVRSVVATVSSNTVPQTTTTALRMSAPFSHALNFAANFYYVRIEIDRAAGNQNVRSIGVGLESTCGDGIISAPDTCDDGNRTDGDGCSSVCTVETGFQCTGAPSSCNFTGVCGNGLLEASEACDDNNTIDGDGCSSTCTVESGFQCSGSPSVCGPVCGDGIVVPPEACDDANTADGDGCSSACIVESGFQCSGSPSVCTPVCGDGIVSPPEACDDANTANGDGCSNTCTVETGFQCAGQPSVCTN